MLRRVVVVRDREGAGDKIGKVWILCLGYIFELLRTYGVLLSMDLLVPFDSPDDLY